MAKRRGRPLAGERVERYATRSALMEAAHKECARVYEALFGQPWNASDTERWVRRLLQAREADREALDALSTLAKGLQAVTTFCEKTRTPSKEVRQGLRRELIFGLDGGSEVQLFLDSGTLPPEAPDEWRAMGASEPLIVARFSTWILADEYDYRLPFIRGVNGEPVLASVPTVPAGIPIELACSRSPADMTQYGFLILSLSKKIVELSATLGKLVGGRRRPQAWESRLAVVALWDRAYGPGELRQRRDKDAQPNRLTPSELATISILCGNLPSLGKKPRTVRAAIDVEARYVERAREALEKLRAANVPIPREDRAVS